MDIAVEPGLALAAFAAGLVSIISPCVLPLIPAYLTYLAGGSPELLERPDRQQRLRVFGNAVLFVLGFSAIFIALGASASAAGQVLHAYGPLLRRLGGLVIIGFGLYLLGVFGWLWVEREARVDYRPGRAGPVASMLLGASFGFGWTPCIGPVLASILILAGNAETVTAGAALLGIYSSGLALPFLAMALSLTSLQQVLERLRPQLGRIQRAAGVLLVGIGVLVFFNVFAIINSYVSWWL